MKYNLLYLNVMHPPYAYICLPWTSQDTPWSYEALPGELCQLHLTELYLTLRYFTVLYYTVY